MSTERTPNTDPASYSHRDLLLLTQILHTEGLLEPAQVLNHDKLADIGLEWFNHESTQLSRRQDRFPMLKAPSAKQLGQLYENLLEDYEGCASTTDLANRLYFTLVEQLEQRIAEHKTTFRELLEEALA